MTDWFPNRITEEASQTFRPVSEGAEKWLYRPVQCLDHGFVYLADYMGTDIAVVDAARVSYGQGTKSVNTAENLIRYLRRHVHTSPSEMVEVKFHCKMPIFVARQWVRHRTANINEYSGRYSEMVDQFYLPEPDVIKKQAKDNKQGRGEDFSEEERQKVRDILSVGYRRQYADYQELLSMGVARELARIPLPIANYTEWYWKIDFHNLMHFLRLRLDSHAQYEIRVFGEVMAMILKDAFPISYGAFEDYQLYALSFSRVELEILSQHKWPMSIEKATEIIKISVPNKREQEEFISKLGRLKFVT
ncbi:MAG: FAD-dependent thymidylate synthase [Candidatus Paceibacterota bacterium]